MIDASQLNNSPPLDGSVAESSRATPTFGWNSHRERSMFLSERVVVAIHINDVMASYDNQVVAFAAQLLCSQHTASCITTALPPIRQEPTLSPNHPLTHQECHGSLGSATGTGGTAATTTWPTGASLMSTTPSTIFVAMGTRTLWCRCVVIILPSK